jgi:hypothetical protein
MRKFNLNFSQNARRVYTATKKAIERCGQFKRVECNDQTFTITARHGMSLLSFGENITIHVVATSTQESEVRIESASRIFLNIINGGANKKIVQNLEDYIRNEVHKLCSDEEIKLKQPIKHQNHDYCIRIFETKQRISSRQ